MTTKQLSTESKAMLQRKLDHLSPLLEVVLKSKGPQKLSGLRKAIPQLSGDGLFQELLKTCTEPEQYIVTSLFAIGQGHHIFKDWKSQGKQALQHLLDLLSQVENHYDTIGGLIGYHVTVLKLIAGKKAENVTDAHDNYLHPVGIDLTKDTAELRQVVRTGIERMPVIVEMYPVGGAGDRLDLHDENTGEALPAAELRFCGRTLLEDLIRDLQAREYLHYKLLGKQVITPIAMMTSHEKNNHQHILKICSDHNWFGRKQEDFFLFSQPLVPVITVNGDWAMQGPLHLMMKPGGHGVIWKLAIDHGIIKNFLTRKHRYALVRQINNPVAGTDHGLAAFLGWGISNKKKFGFASCPRHLNASEGMVVLLERKTQKEFTC